MRTILILLAVFACHSVSFADSITESAAIQGALDARDDFVKAMVQKDFTSITHHGFDVAIREFAQSIRDEQQDAALADELIAKWSRSSAMFEAAVFAASKNADVGDHAPLFPWVEDFLKQMSEKYGTIIYTLEIVKNIEMMNYTIPVVFAPHGTWQTAGMDNRVEYRKHFIPFANLITYYVALYGCQYVATHQGQPELKKVCKPAAEKLRSVMGRYIAPVVSDWIFKAGNQSITIGADRLRYTTAEELARAIQH